MREFPFPDSEKFWTPKGGSAVLTVQGPKEMDLIKDAEHLMFLLRERLRWMAEVAENPQYAVERMLEDLEQAGMANPYLDAEALAKGSRTAWDDLFQADLTQPLLSKFLGEKDTFPLKLTANQEAKELIAETDLEEWTGRATRR